MILESRVQGTGQTVLLVRKLIFCRTIHELLSFRHWTVCELVDTFRSNLRHHLYKRTVERVGEPLATEQPPRVNAKTVGKGKQESVPPN